MDPEVCYIALGILHSIVELELQLYSSFGTDPSSDSGTDWRARLVDMEARSPVMDGLAVLAEKGLSSSAGQVVLAVATRGSECYYKKIQSAYWKSIPPAWLRLYCLFELCKLFAVYPELQDVDNKAAIQKAYSVLDGALLISGGSEWRWFIDDRLDELDGLNLQLQPKGDASCHADDALVSAAEADDLESRRVEASAAQLRCFAPSTGFADWAHVVAACLPFVCARRFHFAACTKWNSARFWRRAFGCRTVPVEIGLQYTHESWTIEHMTLDRFLDCFICHSEAHPLSRVGYIAQYELLSQLPALGLDLDLSEFETRAVLTSPFRTLSQSQYKVWFGSRGTVSPLHHDPNHNFYLQIVGYKRWLLISADHTAHLQAYAPESSAKLQNTSRLDVSLASVRAELCAKIGRESIMQVTIGPGDMLFIPKGWWHYVESESASISLSIWF